MKAKAPLACLTGRYLSVIVRPVSRMAVRVVSAFVLTFWVMPSVGAFALSLHLVMEHHDAHGTEERLELPALLQVPTHSHHHDEATTPDHDHEATILDPATEVKLTVSGAEMAAGSDCRDSTGSKRSLSTTSTRRAPPVALFTAHCSPLL